MKDCYFCKREKIPQEDIIGSLYYVSKEGRVVTVCMECYLYIIETNHRVAS